MIQVPRQVTCKSSSPHHCTLHSGQAQAFHFWFLCLQLSFRQPSCSVAVSVFHAHANKCQRFVMVTFVVGGHALIQHQHLVDTDPVTTMVPRMVQVRALGTVP